MQYKTIPVYPKGLANIVQLEILLVMSESHFEAPEYLWWCVFSKQTHSLYHALGFWGFFVHRSVLFLPEKQKNQQSWKAPVSYSFCPLAVDTQGTNCPSLSGPVSKQK